jgi:hypothetical protein
LAEIYAAAAKASQSEWKRMLPPDSLQRAAIQQGLKREEAARL